MTESPELADRKVIQCNYRVATHAIAEGARAYVVYFNAGGGHDRLKVLVRSRSGRWIETWVDRRRLADFRVKTLPPEHPMYSNGRVQSVTGHWVDGFLAEVNGADPAVTS